MGKNKSAILAAMWTLSAVAGSTFAGPKEPTAEELIRLAPVIESNDENIRSIAIGGSFKGDGATRLNFRAVYRAPDRYALRISDGVDDTPLLFAADRKILIYDPVRSLVFYDPDTRTDFLMGQSGEGCFFLWHFGAKEGNNSHIHIDIKSLYTTLGTTDKVVEAGDGQYRLERTSRKGNLLVSHIDLANRAPYRGVEILMHGTNESLLCINQADINVPVKDQEFAFPDRKRLSEKVTVRDMKESGLLENSTGMALMLRTCNARLAAHKPELRDSINLPGFSGINWDSVKENDEKFSKALKELLPRGGAAFGTDRDKKP